LTSFVSSAIAATCRDEVGTVEQYETAPQDETVLHVPDRWAVGLSGLPGYDAQRRTLRVTRDRDQFRDAGGNSLAFLGRVHPLVRQAIGSVRHGLPGLQDDRVAVARAMAGDTPALLLTYAIEIRSALHLELRQAVAVYLPYDGAAVAISEPQAWLALGGNERAIAVERCWDRLFAAWAPGRRAHADGVAASVLASAHAAFAATRDAQAKREASQMDRWLRTRADAICGPRLIPTGDLFGANPSGPAWRTLAAPLDRLAAFASDAVAPSDRRRSAAHAVGLFQRRISERAERLSLTTAGPRPVGMLMLVPAELCP
ncbi:MAG TPA: hypothetical protein VIG49_14270, partial [Acetobacteraceae bacterium]